MNSRGWRRAGACRSRGSRRLSRGSRLVPSVLRWVGATGVLWCCLSVLGAQSLPPGSLSGQARDAAGAPLAGVTITATRPTAPSAAAAPPRAPLPRNVAHSGNSGCFAFTSLPAGRYLLRAEKPGFVTQTLARTLPAGGHVVVTFTLAAISAVAASTINNTPLNGRDWTQLATLRPGVSSVQSQNASSGHAAQRGFGAALSISGARPEENDYVLDGISISDYSNGAPGSVIGAALGVSAVDRLSVVGSNYPASIGRTSGGVISAATR